MDINKKEQFFEDEYDDSVESAQYPIKVDLNKYDKEIIDIVAMINRKDVNLQPTYQRNFVWNKKRSSKLIESLIVGIPIPPIFLYEDNNFLLEVVDGKQRLTTINIFFEDQLRLVGLELIPAINGMTVKELKNDFPKYYKMLSGAQIRFIVINNTTDERIKFNLFERINTGAEKLNAQEVRNAIYHGPFTELLFNMSENKIFKKVTLKQPNIVKRFLHIEMIARVLTFLDSYEDNFKNYGGKIGDAITLLYKRNLVSFENFEKYKEMFELSLRRIDDKIGFKIFTLKNNKLNRPLFETVMICISFISEEDFMKIDSKKLNKRIMEEYYKDENEMFFQKGTNNTTSVKGRFKIIEELINESFRQ